MVYVLDLAAIAILVFCAWRGKSKGFILTAFSLLAVIVALIGASILSNLLSEPVGNLIEPFISQQLQRLLEELPEFGNLQLSIPSPSFDGNENLILQEIETILETALTAVNDSPLLAYLTNSLNTAFSNGTLTILTSAAASISAFLARQLARAALFFFSFILILVIWWLLSRVLNLAFKLPILRGLNEIGGLVLGLANGVLLLLVACWALISLGVIHIDVVSRTYLLSIFLNFHII